MVICEPRKFPTDMEAVKKMYTYQAIEDVLEMLDRLNGMIALHQAQNRQDTLAVEGYKRQREQFLGQLAELLAPFGVGGEMKPTLDDLLRSIPYYISETTPDSLT